MLFYKNISRTTKTFHGITFEPGDIKQSPKYINAVGFIRVDPASQEPPKQTEDKSADKSKPQKDVTKPEKVEPKKENKPKVEPKPEEVTDSVEEVEDNIKEEKKDGTDSNK